MAITYLKKIEGAGLVGIITALLLIQFSCTAQQKLKPRDIGQF